MKKYSAIKDLTKQEIISQWEERKQELFNLRFQKSTGELENTSPHQADKERYRQTLNQVKGIGYKGIRKWLSEYL